MSAFNGTNGTVKVDLKSLLGAQAAYTRSLSNTVEDSLDIFISQRQSEVNKIEFDFSQIASISRAFAHEFGKLILKLEESGKVTELHGLNQNISGMIALFKEGKGNIRSDRSELTEGYKVSFQDIDI